jgi:hypothetical protein
VESGAIAIVEGYGRENRVIAVHGRNRFLGEVNLVTGSPPLTIHIQAKLFQKEQNQRA